MIKFIKKFRSEEEGAVTVDWVVLTAAVVGLGVAGVATVSNGVDALATKIETGVTAGSGGTGGVGLPDAE
ncbi:hypothetical protein [Roseovarius amoyensis]|uniref:hypothetical protein n=1 Tax=Roseovarius amoyensis TaxID=2211448 RepID=UPI000DBE3F82|nr:hypothetical protein [Roseovarius amoyensis]